MERMVDACAVERDARLYELVDSATQGGAARHRVRVLESDLRQHQEALEVLTLLQERIRSRVDGRVAEPLNRREWPFPPSRAEGEQAARLRNWGKNALAGAGGNALYAVGESPEAAVRAFCADRGYSLDEFALRDDEVLEEPFTWSCRFTMDGTHCKGAGWEVPGGFVLTWWK